MHNYYATHNLWQYWVDILYTIPENLFFRDFFVSARLADTTPAPCFVLLHQITQNETAGVTRGRLKMQSTFLKMVLILGIAFGLTAPAFAVEEKSSATERGSAVMEDAKLVVKAEKSVTKEDAKPAAAAAEAPKAEPPKEEMASKSMTGEVAGISPSFIAVVYDKDNKSAYEMALNLDPKVKIVGKKNISEIRVGDTVTVSYDERFQKDEKGDTRINGRKVTSIAFVREGKKLVEEELPSALPAEEEQQQEESQE